MTINEMLSKTNPAQIMAELDKQNASLDSSIPGERDDSDINNKPDEDRSKTISKQHSKGRFGPACAA